MYEHLVGKEVTVTGSARIEKGIVSGCHGELGFCIVEIDDTESLIVALAGPLDPEMKSIYYPKGATTVDAAELEDFEAFFKAGLEQLETSDVFDGDLYEKRGIELGGVPVKPNGSTMGCPFNR